MIVNHNFQHDASKKNKQKKTIKRNLNLNERAVDIILEIIKVFEQMLEITKAKIHCVH